MTRHGRDYKDVAEKAKRLKIFMENLQLFEEFNGAANQTYKVGTNKVLDLTIEEFMATYAGYKSPSSTHGSCWSFSVVATVEAITKIKSGVLPNLSVQQLLDCATNGGNGGCHGSWMDNGFKYIIENQGISSASYYPYTGVDGTCCKQAASVVEAKIWAYTDVPVNEDDMWKAVAMQKVSVALDASGPAFQHYAGGVLTGLCNNDLDHAVTVVGYGTDEEGTKYWLVRNYWDALWGESGYMRIQRDSGVESGLCGIASKVSYPIYQRDYGLELMCVSRLKSADMN